MLKIAIVALLIALVAGVLGLGGLSSFAMGVSKFFFSAFGLVLILAVALAYLAYRQLRKV